MKIVKKKSVVVFEVNDTNRGTHEYGKYSGKAYFIPFTDFIESLGYDISIRESISEITINGHKFEVNTNNASYMSQNSYNREVNVRKPQNRYITIEHGYKKTLIKIHFNKEYDANKLRAKINDAIQSKESIIQNRINRENNNETNTTSIAKSYIDSGIIGIANNLFISQGEILLHIDGATISFNINGEISKLTIHQRDAKGESGITTMFNDLNIIHDKIKKLTKIIKDNPIPSELSEWASSEDSHGSYIFKTLEYSKY